MGTVNDILNQKQRRQLVATRPNETVLAATRLMDEQGVGSLLVTEDDSIVGIFTERDVLRRVVAEERLPATVFVGEVMTTDVACCTLESSIDEVQNMFRQYRVRHLPVIDQEGDIQGILSMGDVNAYHASHQEVTIHFLNEYLYGRV